MGTSVYVTKDDTKDNINIKKGIAAIFQYKTESGVVNENLVTGLCKINYEASKTKIKKDILECKYPQQSRNHHHQVLSGVKDCISNGNFTLDSKKHYIESYSGKDSCWISPVAYQYSLHTSSDTTLYHKEV